MLNFLVTLSLTWLGVNYPAQTPPVEEAWRECYGCRCRVECWRNGVCRDVCRDSCGQFCAW